MCVVPSLTYGFQTLPLTGKSIRKIQTIQNARERTILSLKNKDQVEISGIEKESKDNTDVARYFSEGKSGDGRVASLK